MTTQLSDRERAIRIRLRDDLAYYARKCLKIRTKSGSVEPLVFNRAQTFIHQQLEAQKKATGRVRALILKGRQQGCCYTPDMRVLTADYRWLQIGDVSVGDRLMAVDEECGGPTKAGRRTERRLRVATVEGVSRFTREVFEVELDSGVRLRVTGEHRHLCRKRNGDEAQWRSVDDLKVGDVIRAAAHAAPSNPPSFEDAWFGGVLDGEGSFGASPQVRIALSQVAGPVLNRARKYLSDLGIKFYELIDRRMSGVSSKLGNKEVHCLRVDCLPDILNVLTRTRPTRFVGRELFVGKKLPKSTPTFSSWARVMVIRPLGLHEVVDLQTSEKTYICEGLVSHNSTFVGARFYHRATHTKGVRVFILTHEDAATANLFDMVERYHEHCPSLVKPETGAANAKELFFARMDSGYKVGTAGTKGIGRSSTIQLFHGSEAAFWPHAETHASGILQAVPDEPGTEIILESTANGLGNFFHQKWRAAEIGQGDFQAIFVPWFWQEEYTRPVPDDFMPNTEEREYADLYMLSLGQLAWRRNKIDELKDAALFKQEYPATAAEAFQTSGQDSYIPPALVAKARKTHAGTSGPLVIGFDPAWTGGDRHSMAWRRGRKLVKVESRVGMDTMQSAGWCKQVLDEDKPKRLFLDVGGVGAGVYDRLCEMGYGDIVRPINFGSGPFEPAPMEGGGPLNRRAEMWMKSKLWLEDPAGAQIPDSDSLQADACGPTYKYDSNTRLVLEKKDDMRRRGVLSPDEWDAVALTFAEPVAPDDGFNRKLEYSPLGIA